jgi:hypothetical protein
MALTAVLCLWFNSGPEPPAVIAVYYNEAVRQHDALERAGLAPEAVGHHLAVAYLPLRGVCAHR